MKLLITQRESVDAYGTPIDILEATYVLYFAEIGVQVHPVPNFLQEPGKVFSNEGYDGLILTGGGSIPPEFYRIPHTEWLQSHRDKTERELITLCQKQDKPILAICRGMQYLNGLWGGKISHLDVLKVPRPIAVDHPVEVAGEEWLVNQYHKDGIYLADLAEGFSPLGIDRENGVVEAFTSKTEKILALQWHPERSFVSTDSKKKTTGLIQKFLTAGKV